MKINNLMQLWTAKTIILFSLSLACNAETPLLNTYNEKFNISFFFIHFNCLIIPTFLFLKNYMPIFLTTSYFMAEHRIKMPSTFLQKMDGFFVK